MTDHDKLIRALERQYDAVVAEYVSGGRKHWEMHAGREYGAREILARAYVVAGVRSTMQAARNHIKKR